VSWQVGQKSDADLAVAAATVGKDLDAVRADLAQKRAAS
jgi:hypothetical protein